MTKWILELSNVELQHLKWGKINTTLKVKIDKLWLRMRELQEKEGRFNV